VVRQRIANPSFSGSTPLAASSPSRTSRRKGARLVPLLALLLCLAAMAVGYFAGDPSLILRKAATICLECIGVG
jgi:hypothetical protein